jgi:hypothetical protein
MTFGDIIAAIPSLTQSQLERVIKEASAARQFANPGSALGNDELLVFICSYCRSHNLDFRSPEMMRRSRHHSLFMEKHDDVVKWLSTFCKTRTERQAICFLTFDQMKLDGATRMNCAGLMGSVHLIPSVFARLFPGYDEMGLLPLIAQRLSQRH